MKSFYLIGYPLSHSFSPEYFRKKFEKERLTNCSYEAIPFETVEEVLPWAKSNDLLRGFNVTIPYKESILPLLDKVSSEAVKIGAVNTVLKKDGKLIGFNTDVIGFEDTLPVNALPDKSALILGTGGSAKAVAFVFDKLGIPFTRVSRNPQGSDIAYEDITKEIVTEVQYIVNTTPLGMWPNEDTCPDFPFTFLNSMHVCYDLVYNPANTMFMQHAIANGALAMNGYAMLCAQAEASWKIWNS